MIEPSNGFKTTLYYSPEGVCEAAYIELASGKAVRKEDPDPRYVVSVYFDQLGSPVGVRFGEHVPDFVLRSVVNMATSAAPNAGRVLELARSAVGSAA